MQRALIIVISLTSALANPRGYSYVPPKQTYIPPLQDTYIPPLQETYIAPSQETYISPSKPTYIVPSSPSSFSRLPPTPSLPLASDNRVQTQSVPRPPVPLTGSDTELPARYTKLDYSPNAIVNRNPGSGSSGPMGVFVGACAASMVCVPETMCNPYTGFVRGGLLFEPTGPSSQPTVALLRCYRLKDGGVGDGVCCQMPHINDPWPDFQ